MSQCPTERFRIAEQHGAAIQADSQHPRIVVTALTVWSRTSHPTMPNLIIEPRDMDDLIAYILSPKSRK